MKPIHALEKEQFKKLFQQEQIDHFEDRLKILEIFLQTENHVTVGELLEKLKDNGYPFDVDFVRETLRLMQHYGFAKRNRFDNGVVRYEHLHLGDHHDHMVCTKCGSIVEFRDNTLEALQEQIAATHGFHMLQHKMEIYGLCADCRRQRTARLPLASAKPGERLVIKDLQGGTTARMRLKTMGLRPGDEIQVITNHNHGQMVIAIDYHRYVIGRGMAEKIWVQPTDGATPEDRRQIGGA